MKPAPFEYVAPDSLEGAVAALAEHGADAKVLAGGQSLMPLLNMRLARPGVLVDLNRIGELEYIRESGGHLAFGALTRQRDMERSELVREKCPLLVEAADLIGHVTIRNRGTVGGSLVHADPAAELPAVAVALGAEMEVAGPGGSRTVPAEEFFLTIMTTVLGPDEVLKEIRFPVLPKGAGYAVIEVARRHGDFALAGVCSVLELGGDGTVADARISLFGVAPTPVRAREAEEVLKGETPGTELFREAAGQVDGAIEPEADLHASAEYRRHVAGVLTVRALEKSLSRCGGNA